MGKHSWKIGVTHAEINTVRSAAIDEITRAIKLLECAAHNVYLLQKLQRKRGAKEQLADKISDVCEQLHNLKRIIYESSKHT